MGLRLRQGKKSDAPVSGPCVYCREVPATDWDHVIPQAWIRRVPALWARDELVPACDTCNRELSAKALFTLPARTQWIKATLWRRRMRQFLPGTSDTTNAAWRASGWLRLQPHHSFSRRVRFAEDRHRDSTSQATASGATTSPAG